MTLISEIIEDAFREGNFVGENNNPTPRQGREAVAALNRVISSIWGDEAGEALHDWPLGAYGLDSIPSPYPPLDRLQRPMINRRLLVTNEAAMTVYLPVMPQDGSRMAIVDPYGRLAANAITLDANGRTIETTATVTLNTNGLSREWFYRADLGNWMRITNLGAADELPFPVDFDDLFIILLAVRLAPRFDKEIKNTSIARMQKQRTQFVARYLQSMPLEASDDLSWPYMSRQSYDRVRAFSSQTAFDRGGYFWG